MAFRWTPDTCETVPGVIHGGRCVIDYRRIGNKRVNEPGFYEGTEQTCPAHQGITGVALAVVVLDESTRRQIAHGIARDVDFSLLEEIISSHYVGQGKARTLEISFIVNVSQLVKQDIQNACDIQFGLDKVKVE